MILSKNAYRISEYIYKAQNFFEEIYEGFRPEIERFQGLRPSYVKATRQPDENGKVVFGFNGVSIVDPEQQEEKEEEKPAAANPIDYYDVKLVIDDPKVCLGEIDYCDWEKRKDFHITVTEKGETEPLDPNDPKYKQVLATLKRCTKVSIDPSLKPNQIAADKIQVSGNIVMDTIRSFLDDEVRRQSFDVRGDQNPHFRDQAYINGLLNLAEDKAKTGDFSILKNYHESREQDIKNELFFATERHKKLKKIVLEKRHQAFNKKMADNSSRMGLSAGVGVGITFAPAVIIGLAALLGASMAIIPLPISIPLHGLLAASTGVALYFGIPKIINFLKPTIKTIAMNTAKEAVRDTTEEGYKHEQLKTNENKLKEIKKKEKSFLNDLKNEQKIKNGGIKTLQAINLPTNNQSLDLSGIEIGPEGTSIICDHLHRTDILPNCNKLILSNCGITEEDAKKLSLALKKAQTDPKQLNIWVQEIDLRNNELGPEGLSALQEALASSFTLTTLKTDQTQSEISNQLLINRYLQGTLTEAPKPTTSRILPLRLLTSESYDEKLSKQFSILFPDGFEQLKKEAIQKLENNFSITALPAAQNKEITELATKVTKQNALLQQLLSTSNPKEIAAKSIEAFNLDNRRFINFIIKHKSNEKLEEAFKKNISPEQKAGLISVMQAVSSRQQKLGSKTLIEQFACLHTSSSQKDFPALRELLDSKNFTLTQFTFPKDVILDKDVKKYLENAIRKNQILEILESMPDPAPKEAFQKFWDIYKAMDPSYLKAPAINIDKLKTLIKSRILDLRDLTLDDRINLLQDIFAPGDDTKHNITLLAKLIEKLPKEEAGISPAMKDTLQKNFDHLSKNHDEFIKGLEGKRQEIATNNLDTEQQKTLLFILDSTLHPELKLSAPDSLAYKKYLLQKLITADPAVHKLDHEQTFANFIDIYKTIPKDQLPPTIDIPGNKNLTENAQLFIALLDKSIKEGAELSPTMQDLLQKNFTARTQEHSEFVNRLEGKRLEIAMKASKNKEQKYVLYTIDSVLHPELKPDSFDYQKYDIQGLINNPNTTFKNFIDVYKTIPKDQAALALAGSDYNKLINLVEKDVYDSGTKRTVFNHLRDPELSSKHKQALLELCFGPDGKNKAQLFTNILSDKKISEQFIDKEDTASFRENFLLYAFTWPMAGGWIPVKHKTYTFDEIKAGLDKARLSLLTQNNIAEAKILDRPLQQVLQSKLIEKFPCLSSSTTDTFTALKEHLNTQNFDLREFEPLGNINTEVKTYIQQILLRNQIRDILEIDLATTNTLKTFAEVYQKIDPRYLIEPPINMQKLLNLVTLDLQRDKKNSPAMGAMLKGLDKDKRRVLLELCFKQDLKGNENYPKKAALISTMIAESKSLDAKNSNKQGSVEYYLDHSFNNPENLETTDILGNLSEEIPPYKYEDLKEKTSDRGKEKDLTSRLSNDFINQRSALNKYANESDLENFISLYSTIPNEQCKEMLSSLDKLSVLKLVAQDLGTDEKVTCKKLRNLKPEHRIALLEHCFLINDAPKNAHQKALITANLLEPWLFKQTSKTSRDIKKQLYWAITPEGGNFGLWKNQPYNPLKNFKGQLETIAKTSGIDPDLKTSLELALTAPGEIPDRKLEQKPLEKSDDTMKLSDESRPQLKKPISKAL